MSTFAKRGFGLCSANSGRALPLAGILWQEDGSVLRAAHPSQTALGESDRAGWNVAAKVQGCYSAAASAVFLARTFFSGTEGRR